MRLMKPEAKTLMRLVGYSATDAERRSAFAMMLLNETEANRNASKTTFKVTPHAAVSTHISTAMRAFSCISGVFYSN